MEKTSGLVQEQTNQNKQQQNNNGESLTFPIVPLITVTGPLLTKLLTVFIQTLPALKSCFGCGVCGAGFFHGLPDVFHGMNQRVAIHKSSLRKALQVSCLISQNLFLHFLFRSSLIPLRALASLNSSKTLQGGSK